MVTGNNYELGLFNGDTGVLMDDAASGRLATWFYDPDTGLRRLSPLRLPSHVDAFALTVHKSQGSEFDKVLLIMPERVSEALSRELLYTALTRARSHVEIWGTEEVFLSTVERQTARSSGLRARLWGRSPS
jgi:exodeoxyribonuclease V alpha subunit